MAYHWTCDVYSYQSTVDVDVMVIVMIVSLEWFKMFKGTSRGKSYIYHGKDHGIP